MAVPEKKIHPVLLGLNRILLCLMHQLQLGYPKLISAWCPFICPHLSPNYYRAFQRNMVCQLKNLRAYLGLKNNTLAKTGDIPNYQEMNPTRASAMIYPSPQLNLSPFIFYQLVNIYPGHF